MQSEKHYKKGVDHKSMYNVHGGLSNTSVNLVWSYISKRPILLKEQFYLRLIITLANPLGLPDVSGKEFVTGH